MSSPQIDTTVAHEARMYDYRLGGKDDHEADRVLGDMIRQHIPTISTMARANRAFQGRVVRHLAAEADIRSSWWSGDPAGRRSTARIRP